MPVPTPHSEAPIGLRRLVAAHAVNRAGDYLYSVSLVVYVFSATGSLSWVAAVSIARLIPAVVLAPLAGVLADRFDRRRVVIVCQLLAAAVMVALATQIMLNLPTAWIPLTAMAAVAVCSPLRPAMTAFLAEIVPPGRRASANSLIGVVENAAIVVGPAAGAAALLLGPAWVAFALNGMTFALAAAIVSGIRVGRPTSTVATAARPALRRDLRDGMHVALRPGVRAIVGWSALAYFLVGVQLVLVAPLSQDLGTGTWGAGCLEAAAGLGGVLAALWLKRRPRISAETRSLQTGVLLTASAIAAAVLLDGPVLAWTVIAAAGAGVVLVDVVGDTQLMERVPVALIGRVDSLVSSVAVGGMIAGNAVGAALIESAGMAAGTVWCVLPVAAVAAGCQIRAWIGSRGRRVRAARIRSSVPDGGSGNGTGTLEGLGVARPPVADPAVAC